MATTKFDVVGVLIFDGKPKVTDALAIFFFDFMCCGPYADIGSQAHELQIAKLEGDDPMTWADFAEHLYSNALTKGIDVENCTSVEDAVKKIGLYFGADITDVMRGIEFDGAINLEDLVDLVMAIPDGHNLIGLKAEGAWYSDKARIGEFGGLATYVGKNYGMQMSTTELLMFAQQMDMPSRDPSLAALVILNLIENLLKGLVDQNMVAQVRDKLTGLLNHDVLQTLAAPLQDLNAARRYLNPTAFNNTLPAEAEHHLWGDLPLDRIKAAEQSMEALSIASQPGDSDG